MKEPLNKNRSLDELPVIDYYDSIDWPMMHPGRDILSSERPFTSKEIDRVLVILSENCLSISTKIVEDNNDLRDSSSVYVRFEVATYGHGYSKSSVWQFDSEQDAGHLGYAWQHYVTPVRILKE